MIDNCSVCYLCRNICDVLLAHENLDVSHALHWNATFKTIRKIIGGVDYKVGAHEDVIVADAIDMSCFTGQ